MPSKQEILNRAAGYLGSERILDPENPATARERRLLDLYNMIYEEVLGIWPWCCARKRRTLTAMEAAPAWGYSYQYALPDGVVQVAAAQTWGSEWDVEGRFLLTNFSGPLNILSIDKVPEAHLHPQVGHYFATRLADGASAGVSESSTIQTNAERRKDPAFIEAAVADNAQGSSLARLGSGWVLAMQTGYAPELDVSRVSPSGDWPTGSSWLD